MRQPPLIILDENKLYSLAYYYGLRGWDRPPLIKDNPAFQEICDLGWADGRGDRDLHSQEGNFMASLIAYETQMKAIFGEEIIADLGGTK